MSPPEWLSSAAALALLAVRPQTLYANVSRRRIRVKPDPEDPRRRLYHGGDVRRLASRRGRPSGERIATEAVSWGRPVLSSAVSTVAHGRLSYRGKDAVSLAARASLEEVAALLWQSGPVTFAGSPAALKARSPREAVYQVLAQRAGTAPPTCGRSAAALQSEAAEVVGAVVQAVLDALGAPHTQESAPLHQRLAAAWRRPQAADLLRRALVLLADHELNASTFAARVAASTGASVPACLLAGFATLSGPLHGTAAQAMLGLAEAAARAGVGKTVREHLESGHSITAFGHPLYPQGDIRAQDLLAAIPIAPVFQELQQVCTPLLGEQPNVDFALAALVVGVGLPQDAPLVLFTLARLTGWIAHVLEQQQGSLIRPRARYSGPPLERS